ncbi:MAG TPA: bacillithiol biosynthesis cysteine-adding enzyme BshC [Phaeodactylibacter sp.]|nr:bacillithiol biosynthesis cysteine-adding enzyme BshC [Phaeodactylibacter sp.]
MSLEYDRIPLSEIPQFSKRDLAYIREDAALRPFYKYTVHIDSFAQVIADKEKENIPRELLVEVLEGQYASLSENEKVNANIRALSAKNCFTVVTAHQPVLFTGPLYYIYKILSTIRLTKELTAHYPAYRFVPVFVSGAEDHDFEEVNHATIFGKKLIWENDEKGPVGKMSTRSLVPVLKVLKEILGEHGAAKQIYTLIENAYTSKDSYGEATLELVHELFKDFGLVVLDMSHPKLKQVAIPIFERELLESPSEGLVKESIEALKERGYKAQAMPREINLFYIKEQLRERTVREKGKYRVLNTDIEFSKEEIVKELHKYPERFSPNVILRPLYQELILPNLGYVGGGGEIAYWLERKKQFEYFGINFPMLIRRSSAMILSRSAMKKKEKLGLSVSDLFSDSEELIKTYLHKNAETNLHLDKERARLVQIYEGIAQKAKEVDPTLERAVKAEASKQEKSLRQLEARFVKAEKRKQDLQVSQLRKLQEQLFPQHSLQERKVNFLSFYTNIGEGLFKEMEAALNPLQKDFLIFQEEA